MAYTTITWQDKPSTATPRNASNLNHQEAGIKNASDRLDTLEAAASVVTANAQTGTTYTLVLTDAGKVVEMNNASANTLTVPPNASVAFPTGTVLDIAQTGAGQTTVAAGSGVTINSRGAALKLAGQYAQAGLIKTATNTWRFYGDITT